MDAFYFLTMLIGIAWLAVWSSLPDGSDPLAWWPFDMVEDETNVAAAPQDATTRSRHGGVTGRSARPDRASPPREPGVAPRRRIGATPRPDKALPPRARR